MTNEHNRLYGFRVAAACFFLLSLSVIVISTGCRRAPLSSEDSKPSLTVAAAADLAPAFDEIGREFQSATGVKVVFSFGSTGILERQIENGAPMDLFAAANADYVNQLESKGLIFSDTKTIYARGRIVLWTTKESPLQLKSITDLTRPEVKRIAIANPDHAPYGMAAREALQAAGIWDAVKARLVYGENIRQTLQYAETGNVEVAIVALSLVQQSDGHWTLVPDNLHKPLDQALAVIKSTQHEKEARQLAAFITGAQGRAVLKNYGFTFPD